MKKLILSLTGIGVTLTLVFASCQKEEINTTKNSEYSNEMYSTMTLHDFIETVSSEEEVSFFKRHSIVDYSNNNIKSLISPVQDRNAKIKWRWGHGCRIPLGVCLIIPIGILEESMTPNAHIQKMPDNKMMISQLSSDNGLTEDGYLSVFEDIFVDEKTTIKEGIYKAHFDESTNSFDYVIVDLI